MAEAAGHVLALRRHSPPGRSPVRLGFTASLAAWAAACSSRSSLRSASSWRNQSSNDSLLASGHWSGKSSVIW